MEFCNNKKGLALIFIAALILVAGLLIVLGFSMLRPDVEQEKRLETKEIIDKASDAVIGFASINDRLPNENEFETLVRNSDDVWGNELVYWADDNLDDLTSSVCGRSTTDTLVQDCSSDETCAAAEDIPNVAFAIISGGENLNRQTLVDVDTSSATASATIQTYQQDLTGIDDYATGLNRAEPYKDLVAWMTIRELKEKAGCSSNPADDFMIITNSIPYGNINKSYTASIFAENGLPWPDEGAGQGAGAELTDTTEPDYKWCTTSSLPLNLSFECNGIDFTGPVPAACDLASADWQQCTSLNISGMPILGSEGTHILSIFSMEDDDKIRMKVFPLSILSPNPLNICPSYRLWKNTGNNDRDAYEITGDSCITDVDEDTEITTSGLITLSPGETIFQNNQQNNCNTPNSSATFLDAVLADGNEDCCIDYTDSGPPDYYYLVDRTCP